MKPLELPGSYSHEDLVELRKLGLIDVEPSDLQEAYAIYLTHKSIGFLPDGIAAAMAEAAIPWPAVRHFWPRILEGIDTWPELIKVSCVTRIGGASS
jgi:hypothetical protein